MMEEAGRWGTQANRMAAQADDHLLRWDARSRDHRFTNGSKPTRRTAEKGVVYLNTTAAARLYRGGGSPVLEAIFNQALRDVTDPQAGQHRQESEARLLARGEDGAALEITLSPLGSVGLHRILSAPGMPA